jgi:two-component system, chemotaxis family, protein-glutamate methylesterase/glutaminase
MSGLAVRVLVVDDSAVSRKAVREILVARGAFDVVGFARDGLDALEKIVTLAPDVVTLDLVMPSLDGVGVLEALKQLPRPPEVVVVSMADEDSELGVAALSAGAFDIVKKPKTLLSERFYELAEELCLKVLAAAERRRATPVPMLEPALAELPVEPPHVAHGTRLLVIGASTGGPHALSRLLPALPGDFPVPIAVVLHMPEGYTGPFARRLNDECALEVLEAESGMAFRPGRVIVARAGMHLGFATRGSELVAELRALPLETPHRPAVDVLFESAAQELGGGVLAVVLTGMGQDGLAGGRTLRAAGGRILTEAEASCVVYGMPRSIVEAGLSNGQASIEGMAALIQRNL